MSLFDTHTHLNADQFEGREDEIVQEALNQGVDYLAVVGFDQKTIERTLELNQRFSGLISAVGWHPTEAESYTPDIEAKLYQWLQAPKVKMLGEIGLDYYWDTASKSKQHEVFRRQIGIAKELNLPITIHNREATEDCYRILKEEGLPQAGGIMHSFGGNAQEAQKFIDLGMHISFSGVLTFKKAEEVRQAAAIVPLERLLVETDAPYLAPVPFRGKENQPQYVRFVAEELAKVRQMSFEEIAQITTRNAFDLFKWQPEGALND